MNSCQNCPSFKKSIFCNQSSNDYKLFPIQKRQFNLKKGQVLFNQFASPNGIYCLKNGSLKVLKSDINGNETIVRIANAGDIIGEDMILSNDTEKSAAAITDSVVCYIDKATFSSLIDNKYISHNLLKKAYGTLRKAEEHIYSCHQKKVIARLAEFLIEQKNNDPLTENSKWKIDLNLNRDELAMLIGTAPETIIRSFSDLKKMGIISGQKTVYINDIKALEKVAQKNLN